MRINSQTLASIALIVMIQLQIGLTKRIKKRQIYREQVLPHAGGKIPETAFETDRLLLNRLQKEGIAIPDGILLEQRNPKVFPYANNDLRPVFKVPLTTDARYTPDEGQYYFAMPPASETTYPIPRITADALLPHIPLQSTVYQPYYRPFTLPNPYLQGGAVSNPNNANNFVQQIHHSHQIFHQPTKNFPLPFVAPYQIIHPTTLPLNNVVPNQVSANKFQPSTSQPQAIHSAVNYYTQNYVTSQILDDFSAFLDRVEYGVPFGIPLD